MSQDQILERKVLAGTTAINKDAKQHQEEAQHRRGSILVSLKGSRVVECGHTRMQFQRPSGSMPVVNPGSVRMPYGVSDACWALLGPGVSHTVY